MTRNPSDSRLRVQTEDGPEAIVILPCGDVDVQSYEVFRSALHDATEAGKPRVVVDMAEVRYIDSIGLGALLSCLRDASQLGCRISLAGCSPHVWRVLQVTGLTQLFRVYQHRDEALSEE